MVAPQVTGAIALLSHAFPNHTPAQLTDRFWHHQITPSTSPTFPMPVYLCLYLFYMFNNAANNKCLIDIHS